MTDTGTDLTTWVYDRIAESGLDDEVGLLVVAALEGERQLDDFLSEGTSSERRSSRAEHAAEAGGTFLRSISVAGFRGIGESTTLELAPRPGLTIVAGRNGSGKS